MKIGGDIYSMEMHEIFAVEAKQRTDTSELWTSVMRVPGGWIYRSYDKYSNMMACVFVPFNNEFRPKKKQEGPINFGEVK